MNEPGQDFRHMDSIIDQANRVPGLEAEVTALRAQLAQAQQCERVDVSLLRTEREISADLRAEQARLKEERDREIVESDAVFTAAMRALDGEAVSDFEASFPLVRRAIDVQQQASGYTKAIDALVEQGDKLQQWEAERAALGPLIQKMREHSVSYESQAEGRDAEDFEFLMDLSGLVAGWADELDTFLRSRVP